MFVCGARLGDPHSTDDNDAMWIAHKGGIWAKPTAAMAFPTTMVASAWRIVSRVSGRGHVLAGTAGMRY